MGLFDYIIFIFLLLSIIGWPIVFIGKWISKKTGKCPESKVCLNTKCKWTPWCSRFETIAINIEHVKQMMEEAEKKEKSKDNFADKSL